MVLTLLERLVAANVLPNEGDILLMRVRQSLISKLMPSAEETKDYEIVQEAGGGVKWRSDLPQDFEIPLSDAEISILEDGLKELSDQKKLTPDHLTLYDKIVGDSKK